MKKVLMLTLFIPFYSSMYIKGKTAYKGNTCLKSEPTNEHCLGGYCNPTCNDAHYPSWEHGYCANEENSCWTTGTYKNQEDWGPAKEKTIKDYMPKFVKNLKDLAPSSVTSSNYLEGLVYTYICNNWKSYLSSNIFLIFTGGMYPSDQYPPGGKYPPGYPTQGFYINCDA